LANPYKSFEARFISRALLIMERYRLVRLIPQRCSQFACFQEFSLFFSSALVIFRQVGGDADAGFGMTL